MSGGATLDARWRLAAALAAALAIGALYLLPRLTPHSPLKLYCLLAGHDWAYYASDDWAWYYDAAGRDYDHPELDGYKYRYIPDRMLCRRCRTYLFDHTIVEDRVYALEAHERRIVNPPPPESMGRRQWPTRRGKLEGIGRNYYAAGALRNEWSARSDELHGPAKGYFPDGKVHWETTYVHGDPDGVAREYHDDGSIKSEFPYRNGRLDGESRQYRPGGRLWRVRHYEAGEVEGEGYDLHEDGSLKREDRFERGRLVDRRTYEPGAKTVRKAA